MTTLLIAKYSFRLHTMRSHDKNSSFVDECILKKAKSYRKYCND